MTKRMIGVYLDAAERTALSQMAEQERRKMRDQAALIIRDKLIECGLLPSDPTQPIEHTIPQAAVQHGA